MVTTVPMPETKKVTINARVDAEAIDKLDQMAEKRERSRSELINFAIREYVEKHFDRAMAGKERD